MNVPPWHVHRQAKCAKAGLNSFATPRDNVPVSHKHYIRQWRKFRGMTQEQLAERVGVVRAQLSKIETGARKYDQEFLELAAVALGCEITDLLGRDPTQPQSIMSIWDQVPAESRDQARAVLLTFAKTGTEG
jgi:transcriptional regulator with XRE-family HTH domain